MYFKDIIFLNIQPDCFKFQSGKNFSKEGSVAPRKPGQLLQTVALLTLAFHILYNVAFHKASEQPRKAALVMAVPFWSVVGPGQARGYSFLRNEVQSKVHYLGFLICKCR